MRLNGTEVVDTFAEAFPMWGARIVITAESPAWAHEAARSLTGFATSVIGCKCEAGIERELDPAETPDGRPGASALLFANDREGLAKRLVERVGQSVLTCPTTACFNGLDAEETVDVGGQLRFFGDGYQASKVLDGRRYWRVPVMEGEFLVEERFAVAEGVAGGNIIILGRDVAEALRAAEAAAAAMRTVRDMILPFPGGIARSGSKVGSRYSGLVASTNDALCPTLRAQVPHTDVPPDIGSVFEIVIDGLTLEAVREAMARGLEAAAAGGRQPGDGRQLRRQPGTAPHRAARARARLEGLMPLTLTPPRAADGAARDRGPQPRIGSPVVPAARSRRSRSGTATGRLSSPTSSPSRATATRSCGSRGTSERVKFIGAGMTAGRLDRRGRCGNAHRRGDAGRRAGRGR